MKKIYLSSLLAAGVLAFASNAGAIDSTGCGLGSMAWRGQSAVIRTGALPAEPAE